VSDEDGAAVAGPVLAKLCKDTDAEVRHFAELAQECYGRPRAEVAAEEEVLEAAARAVGSAGADIELDMGAGGAGGKAAGGSGDASGSAARMKE